jgi:hypothetical protein
MHRCRYIFIPDGHVRRRNSNDNHIPYVSAAGSTALKILLRPVLESLQQYNNEYCSCWDGKNLDSPDHKSHVAYPATGTFESTGPCPASHPIRLPQLMYEVMWDTTQFNDKELWPTDGSQPFVYSMGDK